MSEKNIWTIGHSTHPIQEFVAMLQSFQIQLVADIRSLPGSTKFPQFNKEALEISLPAQEIGYKHFKDLGGLRKPKKDSHNDAWRLASFRGYADYMETTDFDLAIRQLEQLAESTPVAYMCSEAVWWRCHRSLVSDYLKLQGWNVIHIMGIGKSEPHSYTSPARIENGNLVYGKQ